jgi:hypothetical protein
MLEVVRVNAKESAYESRGILRERPLDRFETRKARSIRDRSPRRAADKETGIDEAMFVSLRPCRTH